MSVREETVHLRSNVLIEPLVDRFYAWMHLVAPVPAARNLADFQVPLLESCLGHPPVRRAAGHGPAPRDRSSADIDGPRAMEIAALLDAIRADRAGMLGFAAAMAEAEEMLRRTTPGDDLTPLYRRLPAALNGLVELTYDSSGQPVSRYLESLAYTSRYYDEDRQSVQLSLDDGGERPGILGTPRLPRPGVLDLAVPFRHGGLDELFAARLRPTTISRLREALGLDARQTDQLRTLLDTEPGAAPDRHIGSGGRVRYFGHACLLLQTPQGAVLTDPFISTDNRHGDRYTLADLPDRIDLAVITHGGRDHVVLETLLQLRSRIGAVVVPRPARGNLCDPSIGRYLRALAFPVIEVDDFDEVPFPGGKVVATPFLSDHADLAVSAKSTYFIRLSGATFLIGANSSGVDPARYRYLRSHLGDVDLAFLGLGGGTPPMLRHDRGRAVRMPGSDAEPAAAIVRELGADEAYLYDMGGESWQSHVLETAYDEDPDHTNQVDKFLGWCHERGITAERLVNRREWRW